MCLNTPTESSGFIGLQLPAGIWQRWAGSTPRGQGLAWNDHCGKWSGNQKGITPNNAPPLLPQDTEDSTSISLPLRIKAQTETEMETNSWGKQGIVWSPSFPCPLISGSQGSVSLLSCVTTHIVPYPSFSSSAPKIYIICNSVIL